MAYDNPIPGYKTTTTSNLRLWDAEAVTEFDLAAFNAGDYDQVRRSGSGQLVCMHEPIASDLGASAPTGHPSMSQ